MWLSGWVFMFLVFWAEVFVLLLVCVCVGGFFPPYISISNCLHLSIQFVIPGKTKERKGHEWT